MQAFLGLIIVIIIISAVVGMIAQFLNKINEMANPPARPPARGGAARAEAGGAVRQPDKDMDRFLAGIDRLRKKNAEAQADGGAKPPANTPATPIAKPVKPAPDRSRARVVAELAEPQQPQQGTRRGTDAQGFTTRLERREATDAAGFTTP